MFKLLSFDSTYFLFKLQALNIIDCTYIVNILIELFHDLGDTIVLQYEELHLLIQC